MANIFNLIKENIYESIKVFWKATSIFATDRGGGYNKADIDSHRNDY